jgi:hypothetical protein
MKYGKALTWEQLAKHYPGRAMIMSFDSVYEWAKTQTDKFYIHPINKTVHLYKINKEAKHG